MMRSMTVVLAGLALVAAPALAQSPAGDDDRKPEVSTPTTLYFHINGFQMFPINTQLPSDEYKESVTYGALTHSTSCLAPGDALLGQEFHSFYGYSSPGYVQYDVQENNKPRFHPERGISYDAKLDTSKPLVLRWFLETVAGAGGDPDPNQVPIVMPKVTVQGTMRTGDAVGIDKSNLNTGDIIAQGKAIGTLAGPATDQINNATGDVGVRYAGQVAGRHVYEYTIEMAYAGSGVIPRATGYNLRVDVYIDNPYCADPSKSYLMPNTVAIHTSGDHRPHMELSVLNPLQIDYLHPQFVGEDLVIHTASNSVWGNYDINEQDPEGIVLAIEGPTTPSTENFNRVAIVQEFHVHNKHQEAVAVTYLWDYQADGAQDGVYTVKMVVRNDQNTAAASAIQKFQIGVGDLPECPEGTLPSEQFDCAPTAPKAVKESPAAGILVALGLVGAAFVARRKQ